MWKCLETQWGTLCCLQHHLAWPVLAVGQGWSGKEYPWSIAQTSVCCTTVTGTHCQTIHWCSGYWLSPGAWPQVARVCREFPDDEGIDTTDWPSHSSDLNPAEKLWHKYWIIQIYQVAPQTVQELAYALIQVWQEIPRTPSAISSEACTDIVGSAYKHAGPYSLLTLWVAVMKFLQSCTSL